MAVVTEQRLQVRVSSDAEYSVVEAHGEVDEATAPHLGTILRVMASQPGTLLVLDLRHTVHLAHAGLNTLRTTALMTVGDGFEVQVRAGSQPERALREGGAHRVFSVVVWEDGPGTTSGGEAPGTMELRIPSEVCQVARVRRLTEEVLLLSGADEGWLSDFVTAVGEAVANAVTHGSPRGGRGYCIFTLVPGPEVVVAAIQDFGTGIEGWSGHPRMPPPDSLRGRGLGMMEIFTDRLEVHTSNSGTLVRLHKQRDW